MTEIFSTIKKIMGQVIHEVKFEVKVKVTRSLPIKHAYSENSLTEMESLGNFLQNDTKFVQIPLKVAEKLLFEIW